MRAQLQHLRSPDADLDGYRPEDPSDFAVTVELYAGPDGSDASESFVLTVCTPAWLAGKVKSDGPMVGRHLLIVDRWDRAAIEAFLKSQVESYEGADWDEVAEKIGRIGRWEFEDYEQ